MASKLVHRIAMVLRSEKGIETLEWILIGALITGVGIFLYPGTLQTQLGTAITTVGGLITGAA